MSRPPSLLARRIMHLATSACGVHAPRAMLVARAAAAAVHRRALTSSASARPGTGTVGETLRRVVKRAEFALEHDRSEQAEGVAERGLRMLMFGKPGVASLLKHYDISFVSTGDVLRQEISAGSEIGRRAEDIVKAGGLVPDELMLDIVVAELDRLQGKSWIIDGFPRTLHQGGLLDKVLNEERRPLTMIVHINVPDSVIMARIAARWVHLPSGRVYNTSFSAPKVPGKDDVTGEPLVQRPDDTPAVFSKRLEAYYASTAPLLEYFANSNPQGLKTLTGSSSDELWPQLQALVEPFGLRRRADLTEADVTPVRERADDLRGPE